MTISRIPQFPPRKPATDSSAQRLLHILRQSHEVDQRPEVLPSPRRLYLNPSRRTNLSTALLELRTEDPVSNERRAFFHLVLGQKAQGEEKWDVALEHYACGLSCLPKRPRTLYLLYSNSALCRNMFGFYSEAEQYCRLAIAIDPRRHHAFKNLGVSLRGQGDFAGAAWFFLEAMRKNRSDCQALELFRDLLVDHPMLPLQNPWLEDELEYLERG
jgi:tetratricopeptide (TPR) repeat protein